MSETNPLLSSVRSVTGGIMRNPTAKELAAEQNCHEKGEQQSGKRKGINRKLRTEGAMPFHVKEGLRCSSYRK